MTPFSAKTKKWVLVFWILMGGISAFRPAAAQEFATAVSDWPPHIIVDSESGHVGGIDVDILRELLERAGFRLRIGTYPFKRCLMMLKMGDADIACALLKRPERELYLHYLEPPYFTRSVKAFYLRKGKGCRLRKYEDLHGMRIGTMAGYRYFPRFDSDSELRRYPVDTRLQMFKMLARDRFDTFIETETVGDYFVAKEGFGGQFEKAPFRYEGDNPVHMAVSKKSPLAGHLPRLGRIMDDMLKEGRVGKIRDKYLNP